jgi:hypothetical protein
VKLSIQLITCAALGALLTSTAWAGCGRAMSTSFSVLLPDEKVAAREALASSDNPGDGPNTIVGLWLTTVSVDGQSVYQAFESFSSDGLEVLNDNGAPQAGNVCLGVWTSAGRNIKVNHPSWNYDSNGNLIGTVVIREQVALDPGGNSFKGTVSVDVYDLNGKQVQPTFTALLSGKRITVN